MKQMLETGVHFGHQTRRWNPKMRPFIFGARNGIHIIDLQQTVRLFQTAHDFIAEKVARGGKIIFIGTKRQAQDAVKHEASRAGQYFITNRWMGGTLTNFQTIKRSIDRLKKLEEMFADGTTSKYTKKEVVGMTREVTKLNNALGGIKDMEKLPAAAFIIDPKREDIAVKECRKLGIPIVGVVDTNCDPDVIDYIIPGNDDAIRAIKLFVAHMADACLEGGARQDEVAMVQAAEAAQARDKAEDLKPEAPKTEVFKVEVPKVEAKVEAPKVEAPKTEVFKVEVPKVEAPKVEAPKVEAEVKAENTEEASE